MEIRKAFYGLLARFLNKFISVKPKHWVFGADFGNSYREGSKYLVEYMLDKHPDYTCTFVTKNKSVLSELRLRGIPCKHIYSLSAIVTVGQAEAVFATHFMEDVLYAYPKRERQYFHLVHGQPYKLAFLSLPKAYDNIVFERSNSPIKKLRQRFRNWMYYDWELTNSSFVSATSDFLATYMDKDFAHLTPVKVLGMPRNDALFQHERMNSEKWIDGIEGKTVFVYMPTHRAYGRGKASPTPFVNRPEVQKWMRENQVVLLMKNHPNMISQIKEEINTDVIIDITRKGIDPQVCIYHSDALITDYSSVWMDYLLLRRPIIFYTYDSWEKNDAGVHYDIHEVSPGHFCKTEDELFDLMKKVVMNSASMIPSEAALKRYHKYVDGNSCDRYYDEITKMMHYAKD